MTHAARVVLSFFSPTSSKASLILLGAGLAQFLSQALLDYPPSVDLADRVVRSGVVAWIASALFALTVASRAWQAVDVTVRRSITLVAAIEAVTSTSAVIFSWLPMTVTTGSARAALPIAMLVAVSLLAGAAWHPSSRLSTTAPFRYLALALVLLEAVYVLAPATVYPDDSLASPTLLQALSGATILLLGLELSGGVARRCRQGIGVVRRVLDAR